MAEERDWHNEQIDSDGHGHDSRCHTKIASAHTLQISKPGKRTRDKTEANSDSTETFGECLELHLAEDSDRNHQQVNRAGNHQERSADLVETTAISLQETKSGHNTTDGDQCATDSTKTTC